MTQGEPGVLAVSDPSLALVGDHDRFVLERSGHRLREARSHQVRTVLIFGGVDVRTSALDLAMRRQIEVVFLTAGGRFRGRLAGRPSLSGLLRLEQARWSFDPARGISVAREIVRAKIHNQRALLLRVQRKRRSEILSDALAEMRVLGERARREDDLDRLRGLEGQAAALYFGRFAMAIENDAFEFKVRTRRPPRDPVNAALSFGYTLLGVHAESALLAVGLDPGLGFLHAPARGRASLMLDLIEEFRPIVVDSLVLRLLNRAPARSGRLRECGGGWCRRGRPWRLRGR